MKIQMDAGKFVNGSRGGGEGGFSLIELLIALTIFAVGILAVAAMQTAAMRAGSQSSTLTQAVRDITQDRIEDLLSKPFGDADLAGSAAPGTTHTPVTEFQNGVTYTIQWTVVDDTPHQYAKTVTVTTTWSDMSGAHTVNATFIKDSIL